MGGPPIEKAHGGVVEAVGGPHPAALGATGVDRCPHLAGQDLAQLHTPLVKRVDAPDEALRP
jgi:hypothetical protein